MTYGPLLSVSLCPYVVAILMLASYAPSTNGFQSTLWLIRATHDALGVWNLFVYSWLVCDSCAPSQYPSRLLITSSNVLADIAGLVSSMIKSVQTFTFALLSCRA